jgi:hypothetical protein
MRNIPIFTINAVTIYVFIPQLDVEVNDVANVLETTGKKMESGEQVLHQYRTILDGHDGFLVLSNQRIRFLRQKGLFRAKFEVSINVPYQKVKSIYTCSSHQLALTTSDKEYYFVSVGDILADIIVDEIKDIKQQFTQH